MPADLRSLMAEPSFRLTPLAAVDAAALDAPLRWAHNSDLPDPTPWLEPGGLLLTDGAPFLPPHNAPVDAYVERLVALGVRALGVSVGILVDRVPPALVAACERLGMPLIEVSRQTPFMGVIKAVSDATAADERARLERSLLAQRRVARAALRPDGLSAILRELERALETWVALFDASGALVLVSETTGIPAALDEPVREAATAALAGRRAAAARVSLGGVGEVTLQTLGQHGNLRGVLAVGISSATFDRARQDLVDSVIALASISLEQSSTLDSARRRLRSGILELLAAGVTDVAGDTVKHLWGRLPPAPLRVARLDVLDSEQTLDSHPLIPALEVLAEKRPGALFFAQQDDHVVAVYTDGDDAGLFAAAAPHHPTGGVSSRVDWDQIASALGEARRAQERASARQPIVFFDELAGSGILGHLEQTRAHDVARRMLLPLDDDPELRRMLEVWLEHNGSWGTAAGALGIHRHTLRHRVDGASLRLGLDLETFGGRAELWNALRLTAE
ncbi:PucR family transcriptional regulator ligand-binding domain-containing protein [Microbacterium sp. KSW2-29]|uniref:PucR family transcriptional regulator ligand-binding domain-containing protein n=1 Tax=Microbacterium phycohabitans TaxID=3075993 RepID=A0ABU3SKV9_9MICO|nr:PucR family transcriptional regulator ligand-binding domain-containing protein [Microbacterium sp. KSW2-29]MDU0345418.1 PucR family transcriptional regulator ligand-binding domain-containing protein [Microbacterium sp. KSW2-29]